MTNLALKSTSRPEGLPLLTYPSRSLFDLINHPRFYHANKQYNKNILLLNGIKAVLLARLFLRYLREGCICSNVFVIVLSISADRYIHRTELSGIISKPKN